MDYYINRILFYTNMSCNEYDIMKDIIEDLDLTFELYCDTKDKRLRSIFKILYKKSYEINIQKKYYIYEYL